MEEQANSVELNALKFWNTLMWRVFALLRMKLMKRDFISGFHGLCLFAVFQHFGTYGAWGLLTLGLCPCNFEAVLLYCRDFAPLRVRFFWTVIPLVLFGFHFSLCLCASYVHQMTLKQRHITVEDILALHNRIMGHSQPLDAGKFRDTQVGIGVERRVCCHVVLSFCKCSQSTAVHVCRDFCSHCFSLHSFHCLSSLYLAACSAV